MADPNYSWEIQTTGNKDIIIRHLGKEIGRASSYVEASEIEYKHSTHKTKKRTRRR